MKTSAGVDPVKYMLLSVIYLLGVKAGDFFIYLNGFAFIGKRFPRPVV